MMGSHYANFDDSNGHWDSPASSKAFKAYEKPWKQLLRAYKMNPWPYRCGILGTLCILYFLSVNKTPPFPYVASSSEKDAFVEILPNFLSLDEFNALRMACIDHELTVVSDGSDVYPTSTSGWVVKFSSKGINRFKNDLRFQKFIPFFNKIVGQQSNAFVMRLLVASANPEGNVTVARHREENVAIDSTLRFTPHNVSMLHVDVPTDMIGGEVIAWPGLTIPLPVRDIPAEVFPARNAILVMRGDSEYLIKPFRSTASLVNLIIEQYQIPARHVRKLTEYCVGDSCI